MKLELDRAQSARGDGDDAHLGFAFGAPIGSRGHFVVALEAQQMDPIDGCAEARAWCAESVGLFDNNAINRPPFPPAPGPGLYPQTDPTLPRWNVAADIRSAMISTRGVIFGSGGPVQVTADGTGAEPFDVGGFPVANGGGTQVGGDGTPVYAWDSLRANVDRRVVYASFDRALTDRLSLVVEASAGRAETTNRQRSWPIPLVRIWPENAFIQNNPALLVALAANQIPPGFAYLNKDWSDQADTRNETTTDVRRLVLGFDGAIGDSSWTWDAYYQLGTTNREQLVADVPHLTRQILALDSILDANGNPICRSGVLPPRPFLREVDPRLAEGCVPINPFGTGPIPAEALAYVFGYLRQTLDYDQHVAAFTASGEIGQGWGAGPIRLAAGLEHRAESGNLPAADELPEYLRTDFTIQYGDSVLGDVDIDELFAEIDLPIVNVFELNVASRKSFYTNTGALDANRETRRHSVSTWKVSGNWTVAEPLTIRFSQSRDIRVAGFNELYFSRTWEPPQACINPWTSNPQDFCRALQLGNFDLDPERADTTTLGFVITRPRLGLRVAADYYDIDIAGAISRGSYSRVQDGCLARIAEFCDAFNADLDIAERAATLLDPNDPLGGFVDIVSVRFAAFNYEHFLARGVDLTANWARSLARGSLNLRLIASRALEQRFTTLFNPTGENRAGMTGAGSEGYGSDGTAAPDWLANLIVTWQRGRATLTGQMRYTSAGILDYQRIGPEDTGFALNLEDSISTNRVPAHYTFNVATSYELPHKRDHAIELYGVVNNLLDEDPPIAPPGIGGTNPVSFDTIGRYYRLGLRMRFRPASGGER